MGEKIFDNSKFGDNFGTDDIVQNKSDFIFMDLTKEIALKAIENAHNKVLAFEDNIRNRSPIIRFDSTFRGEMAELGVRLMLQRNGISYKISDAMNKVGENKVGDTDITVLGDGTEATIEVKSSLLPTSDDFNDMNRLLNIDRDIKILHYFENDENPYSDISKDIYIQVYYRVVSTKRDLVLKPLESSFEIIQQQDFSNENVRQGMYTLLDGNQLLSNCFIVGWTTNIREKQYLEALKNENKKQTWDFGTRKFWKCPLNNIYIPAMLIPYLQSLGSYNSI